MKIKQKLLFLSVFLSLASIMASYSITYSQQPDFSDQNCAGGYSTFTQIPSNKYDVYFKSSDSFTDSNIKLFYSEPLIGGCTELISHANNFKELQKIGSIDESKKIYSGSFTVVSKSAESEFGSNNSPTILLKPKDLKCDITKNCPVNYDGTNFNLLPKVVSLRSDSLKIAVYSNPAESNVERVIYSEDKIPVLESTEIKDFDPNYVSIGKHELQRTILLDDGQALVDTENKEIRFTPTKFISQIYYRNKSIVDFVFLVTGIILVISTIFVIIRVLINYSKRRKMHTNFKESGKSKEEVLRTASLHDKVQKLAIFSGITFGIILSVVLVNNFAVGTFKVDGTSMETTLHDGDIKLINKIPVTYSRINKGIFTPKRGDVVVVKHEDNNVFELDDIKTEKYVVKRVIALPGERVVISDGILMVYNETNPKGFNPDTNVDWQDKIEPSIGIAIDVAVGTGELFVAGDNRSDSVDSRMYGPVDTDKVVGKVIY